jgi:hypothetical protein
VRASDKRAQFISLGAYEAAGGNVPRDLFEEDHFAASSNQAPAQKPQVVSARIAFIARFSQAGR